MPTRYVHPFLQTAFGVGMGHERRSSENSARPRHCRRPQALEGARGKGFLVDFHGLRANRGTDEKAARSVLTDSDSSRVNCSVSPQSAL